MGGTSHASRALRQLALRRRELELEVAYWRLLHVLNYGDPQRRRTHRLASVLGAALAEALAKVAEAREGEGDVSV